MGEKKRKGESEEEWSGEKRIFAMESYLYLHCFSKAVCIIVKYKFLQNNTEYGKFIDMGIRSQSNL